MERLAAGEAGERGAHLLGRRHVDAHVAHADDEALDVRIGRERVEAAQQRLELDGRAAAEQAGAGHLGDRPRQLEDREVRRVGLEVRRRAQLLVGPGLVERAAEHHPERAERSAHEPGEAAARARVIGLRGRRRRGVVLFAGAAGDRGEQREEHEAASEGSEALHQVLSAGILP